MVQVTPAPVEWLEALVVGDDAFTERFGIAVAPDWVGFPEALGPTLEGVRRRSSDPWGTHLFFDDSDGALGSLRQHQCRVTQLRPQGAGQLRGHLTHMLRRRGEELLGELDEPRQLLACRDAVVAEEVEVRSDAVAMDQLKLLAAEARSRHRPVERIATLW